ncbi:MULTISPECIES: NAD(+)/NADH kinase [Aminobacterium]|jgi:NAD+ kinase|uniref:NAD kinase n=1 Tax=Aminobacterium colombiense (strain DSM 12261 / ALA-1) TaxID=572547 RepID=D5EEJ8_AMICL|nr:MULTISPECIES: NAD(+)/NADH kinase [Aminobacterium]MDD2378856.1 NAD(+)/NADH kinase [Aminobacterium colombiense]ADE56980.1 ATP-NAD/AcoX kinase [Aminobacterium colombiense DSM 12261]MDD3767602.1 NAD(+)/NADH kinase [Aminobacterium colombiense]MDD4266030.1 NAD(+)/NADH kinase [Aminobacterium colombiense]MDD4585624.1 NAD(+)/NADH kinase [Aminobacterium colombiense]
MEKKIGMLVNTQKKGALDMANRLVQWGKKKGIVFLFPPHEASILGVQATPDDVWKSTIDFAVVIGGDGTFLRASRYILNHSISLYGINLGHLGFLACGKPEEAEADLEQILREEYALQQHRILEGIIWREGRRKHTLYALNDLVLTKGAFARVITIEIRIDNRYFNMLPADGVIVSTPTGSTAYALSAGGPIVPPHVPCMVLAPICAHTLYARPVIVGENDVISLIPRGTHRDLMLTQDGQLGYEILPGDRIELSLSRDKVVNVVTLPQRTYFDLLQEKLKWGQGIERNENKE